MSNGPTLTRVPRLRDWSDRLARFVILRWEEPFAWGVNDCALHLADAVAAMTGADPLHELRGARSTALGAARVARRIGGVPAALARAGLQPIDPALAQRGDAVLLHAQPGQRHGVFAVCCGDQACAPGRWGIAWAPMSMARQAWRV